MPHVIVKLWPGKSDDQKRRLTETITSGVMETLGYGEDADRLRLDATARGHRVGGPRFAREIFHAHLGNTYDRSMAVTLAQA